MKRHKFNNPILMWNCRFFRIEEKKMFTLALYRRIFYHREEQERLFESKQIFDIFSSDFKIAFLLSPP